MTLYKFTLDWGRMGTIQSLFVADPKEVEAAYGKVLYFGEALGKHSEVEDELTPEMLEEVTDDPDFIDLCINRDIFVGPNPLDHIHPEYQDDYVEEGAS